MDPDKLKGITFNGQPLAVHFDEQKATEARVVRDDTVRQLISMKRKGARKIKERGIKTYGKHGRVRYYSDQEVFMEDQKQLAKNFDLTVDSGDPGTKARLERVLKYVANCVSVSGGFRLSDDVLSAPDLLYEFMGETLTEPMRKGSTNPYHRYGIRADLTKLEKWGKIYHKGKMRSKTYFLGKREIIVNKPEHVEPEKFVAENVEAPAGEDVCVTPPPIEVKIETEDRPDGTKKKTVTITIKG